MKDMFAKYFALSKTAAWFLAVFAGLSCVFSVAGGLYYEHQKNVIKIEKHTELATISQLKIREIVNWLEKRLDEAHTMLINAPLMNDLAGAVEDRNQPDIRQKIAAWMRSYCTINRYTNLFLLDAAFTLRFAARPEQSLGSVARRLSENAVRTQQIALSDLYRHEDGQIAIDSAIPLRRGDGTERVIGVLILRMDPHDFLYPLIQSWPTPSASSETLLVRREDNSVLFLNDLRFTPNAALSLQKGLTDTRSPAVRAALGMEGIFEGVDYRGVPVLSDIRKIPDSPWFMVTKVDSDEIFAPIRDQAILITTATLLLITLVGVGMSVVWNRQQSKTQAVIQQLNVELLDKNTELEQIVYVASHDLRSPLVNIQGFSQELQRSFQMILDAASNNAPEEQLRAQITPAAIQEMQAAFDFIFKSTRKMDALLTGLLRLSRLGRTALTPKVIDMNALLSEIVKTCEYRIQQSGVAVTCEPLPPCVGDEVMINQVFSNLLDNALKFISPNRPGVIAISGATDAELSVYRVSDNGIGIAADHQAKVFDMFYRLNSKISGEGMGLTIIRKIVDRHHGTIRIESAPNQGCTFFVAFPNY